MKTIGKINLTICTIAFILLISNQIHGQAKIQGSNSGGRGVIVGKDGQAFRTNSNGECSLLIPDWLFERIKKMPNKYRLKISLGKVPTRILENKLKESAKPEGSSDVQIKFAYIVTNGNKKTKGDYTVSINKSNIGSTSLQKIDLPYFALSSLNDPNVIITYTMVNGQDGEPIPGAEIYVELEPDDEP